MFTSRSLGCQRNSFLILNIIMYYKGSTRSSPNHINMIHESNVTVLQSRMRLTPNLNRRSNLSTPLRRFEAMDLELSLQSVRSSGKGGLHSQSKELIPFRFS